MINDVSDAINVAASVTRRVWYLQEMEAARQEVVDLKGKERMALENFNQSQKDVNTNMSELRKYTLKAKEQQVHVCVYVGVFRTCIRMRVNVNPSPRFVW